MYPEGALKVSAADLLWTEKYRPRSLAEIVDLEQIVAGLRTFAEKRNLPNLLFVGPPGTAKTTAALCLANDLYKGATAGNVLELNASDERGIQTVREVVKDFARARPVGEGPSFKILILDECDNMTGDAQQALRRTMERYAPSCRFVLIANYQWEVIEPIQSRCSIFRFTPFPEDVVVGRLKYILGQEKVGFDEKGLREVAKYAEGDMRRAINLAQGAAASGKKVTPVTVVQVAGRMAPGDVQVLLDVALEGDFEGARKKLREILLQGLPAREIVREVHGKVAGLGLSEGSKLRLIEYLGDVDYRVATGGDPEVQLSSLLAKIVLLGSEGRVAGEKRLPQKKAPGR